MNVVEKIIVLGIGNVLHCDEGVGVRVVEALITTYQFPEHVSLYDGGTTGMLGLLPIIEEADHLIVVDAMIGKGMQPGDIRTLSADDFRLTAPKKMSAHDVGFLECLAIADVKELLPETVTIIGVCPADFTSYTMALSPTIAALMPLIIQTTLHVLEDHGVVAASIPRK